MLLDTEAEVSVLGEVLSPQFVLLHLQAALENLLSLRISQLRKRNNNVEWELFALYLTSVIGKFESLLSCERWLKTSFEQSGAIIFFTDLGSPDGAVDGDLLVPSDTKTTDSVAGFAEHRGLPCQRLKHL